MRKDCLNTVRLLAALEVLYFHTIEHLEITMPQAVSNLVSFFHGVPIFFTLSGFLIWMSVVQPISLIHSGQLLKKSSIRKK